MPFLLKFSAVASRLKENVLGTRCIYTVLKSEPINPLFHFRSPAQQTLHSLLEECSSMRELRAIHAQIIVHGLTNENFTLGKVISFCAIADSGELPYAQLVFDRVTEPNKFMYNSLIRGYSNSDDPLKAVLLYRKMISSDLRPNEFTIPFVFKACASKLAYWDALVVYCQSIKLGIGSLDCVQNALIGVFVACGLIGDARKLFDDMPNKTLISWNSMIGGYSKHGCCREVFLLFREMKELDVKPDSFTFVNLLSVCSLSQDLYLGRYVHAFIKVSGIKTDIFVGNALLGMYAKCGDLHSAKMIFDRMPSKNVVSWTSMVGAYARHGLVESAWKIFDQMPVKNVVSWNLMISFYVQNGRCKEGLNVFQKMRDTELVPDEATLASVLSACSQIGDLDIGKKTHNYICSLNIGCSVTLYNSLVDMYAKCGELEIAMDIFNKMREKSLVSWNVIIGAFALHGHGIEAVKLFDEMLASGFWPDRITFTALLSACSHSGLVDIGRHYFESMTALYGVSPELQHYACMVDLLGRGGLLGEAIKLLASMPVKPDVVVWGSLLGACRTHGYVEIGKLILKQLLELAPHSAGLYVLLSNMYSEAQRWEEVRKIRRLMGDHGIIKCKAISYIEINGCVYEFLVDDRRQDNFSGICPVLDHLTDHLKSGGYSCNPLGEIYDEEES